MGIAYNTSIVSSGLVFALDAGNTRSYSGSGNTAYGLINSINGTLVNGVGYTSTDFGSFYLDGTNDSISYASALMPSTSGPFTISLWVKRNRNSNAFFEELASQWTSSTSWNAFFIGFYGNLVRFSDNWDNISVSGAGNTGVWMNLVGVHSVSNAYIYLNGTLGATKGGTGLTYTGSGPFVIGRQGETAEYFQGNIGQVQIYNRALTAQEIAQNFNATRDRYGI